MLWRVPDASSWGHVVLGRKEKGEKYPGHLCSWYISSFKENCSKQFVLLPMPFFIYLANLFPIVLCHNIPLT